MNKTDPDILQDAIKIIKTDGWFQGNYRSPYDDSVCLLGAINKAIDGDPRGASYIRDSNKHTLRKRIVLAYLMPILKRKGWKTVAGFNDSIGTQKEDVLNALREALKNARKEWDQYDILGLEQAMYEGQNDL